MTKRFVAFFMTLSLLLTLCIPVSAEPVNKEPQYYTINMRYTDSFGTYDELVDFMIDPPTNGVYIRADYVPLLTGDFNYIYELAYPECAIASSDLGHMVRFTYDSKKVKIFIMGKEVTYTSPLPARFVDNIAWLPFDFLSGALNFSYTYLDKSVFVNTTQLTPMTALSAFYAKRSVLQFDWITELGQSETNYHYMTDSANMVYYINGLLNFKSGALSRFFTGGLYTDGYEKDFTDEISELFVTPSQQELSEDWDTIKKDSTFILDFCDKLAGYTGSTEKLLESFSWNSNDLTNLYQTFIDACPQFAKDAKFMEKVEATKYSALAKDISEKFLVNKNLDLSYFEVAVELISIVDFAKNAENANTRAVEAMSYYGKNGKESAARFFKNNASTYGKGTLGAIENYIGQNFDDVVMKSVPFEAFLGPAALALLGWDLLSGCVPYFKNGLDNTEAFLRSRYATDYQDDSYILLNKSKSAAVGNGYVKESKLKDMLDSGYAYMKFSLIARDSAKASINNAKNINDKDTLIRKLTKKNEGIALLLCAMEDEDPGFLPSESASWTSDDDLAEFIRDNGSWVVYLNVIQEPVLDLTTLPEGSITAEEAIELAKKAMYHGLGDISFLGSLVSSQLEQMLDEYNVFTHVDDWYVEDYGLPAYVINIENDDLLLFVPVDGECVWFGIEWLDMDNTYYTEEYRVYMELNLLEPSLGSYMSVMGAVASDLLQVVAAEQQREREEKENGKTSEEVYEDITS